MIIAFYLYLIIYIIQVVSVLYKNLFNLDKTISKSLFIKYDNEFEVLKKIKEEIIELGKNSNLKEIHNNIFIGENVIIDKSATIIGPCIIDDNTVIRPNAYIRENVIIGKDSVIGNSCELKNSIIFDECQIPHFNYVGDSIIGYHSHFGAGVIISNLKNDKSNIVIKGKEMIDTGMRKFGCIIGSNVDIGCNSVIFPGTIIKNNVSVYPLTRVRGVIEEDSIVKDENKIEKKY